MRKLFNYGCAAIASSLVVGNAVAQSQKRMDKDRPNLFLFIADDWSAPHAGVYGDKTVKTPAIDYVAQNGVTFMNAYCAHPRSAQDCCKTAAGEEVSGQIQNARHGVVRKETHEEIHRR